MRDLNRQFVRLFLVLAIGAGLAALAVGPRSHGPAASAPPNSAATVSAAPDLCLRSPIGAKAENFNHRKIVACG